MNLQTYLDRIGFTGPVRADAETLRGLHRAHLLAIPYENLDVQLGRRVSTDPAAAFEKIVTRGRGGWCYEMNGLFGAMLELAGFRVRRVAGGVHRLLMGEAMVGNHLVLVVDLDEPWIADVGFGDGPLEPFRLAEGPFRTGGFEFRLERVEDGWWRFHNHPSGGAPTFDFRTDPADTALLQERCDWLQSAPESPFVLTATCQRHRPGEILVLRGRVMKRVRPDGADERLIGSADELISVLKTDFGLDLPDAEGLWPRICARHEALTAPQPV